MGNATSALVNKDFCLDYLKQNKALQDGCQSCAQQKPHDTRNREDFKRTLQVLFLCTIKRVFFIVDISNRYLSRAADDGELFAALGCVLFSDTL